MKKTSSPKLRRRVIMSLYFLLLLLFGLGHDCLGQRLSQGASDWYMRFHHNFNDYVKRHIDKPVTRSFLVTSVIKHRYAITEVRVTIYNPAQFQQEHKFGFVMAKTALMSNVTLWSASGRKVKSTVDASDWALAFMENHHGSSAGAGTNGAGSGSPAADTNGSDVHAEETGQDDANRQEQHGPNGMPHHANGNADAGYANGHYQDPQPQHLNYLHHRADFKQFVLPLKIAPMDEVTLILVYEYLMERVDNLYSHVLSISPGEIVENFHIKLAITENRPLTNVRIVAPVIGDITDDASVREDPDKHMVDLVFNMTNVEQEYYFGKHGFAGDFKVAYDLQEMEDQHDLVVQDDFFVHFYAIPERITMKSIPKHIMFLLDVSESMAGPKLVHAKQSVMLLLDSLDASHFMNLIVFDNGVREWHHNETVSEEVNNNDNIVLVEAFPCNNETYEAVGEYLAEVESVTATVANITYAIERAIMLNKQVWATGKVPDNALTMIVLLTDGRSALDNDSEVVSRQIRMLNRASKIPVFVLGMGFDANMEFLEDLAEASCGRACAGSVIEDFEAEAQLSTVRQHLNDVVFKNLMLDYVGDDVFLKESLTKNVFKVFHQGGSVSVAGQFDADDPYSTFKVQITGQSAEGDYKEKPPSTPFVTNGCFGSVTLCRRPGFQGDCLTVQSSRENLNDFNFDDSAASVNVTGNCAWVAYSSPGFVGENIILLPGGQYEGLPGHMHQTISSLRVVARPKLLSKGYQTVDGDRIKPSTLDQDKRERRIISKNSVARLWAFVSIKDVLEKATDDEATKAEVEKAYSLAMKYHFLTPFTDIYFVKHDHIDKEHPGYMEEYELEMTESNVEPPPNEIVVNNLLTYGDLSPIFYQESAAENGLNWNGLKGCKPPIVCKGNFHVEEYIEQIAGGKEKTNDSIRVVNCTGSITVYTSPGFEGESMKIEGNSVYQLYHSTNSQRMRSIKTEGDCCWLIFDHRFFSAGDVDRVCGGKNEPMRRKNIGSIKRIDPPSHY